MQILNFRNGHLTTFRHPSVVYICQMPGHRLSRVQTSKRHTFRVLAFHRYHWFGVKLFPVGCAQDSRRVPLKCEKNVFLSGSPTLQEFRIFHDSTRPHLHFGSTENAGPENDGPSKSPGMKMHDMTLKNQIATHENARHENDGPICKT